MGLLCRYQPIHPKIIPTDNIQNIYQKLVDFADVIYDQACNFSFHEKLESIQCNTCLAIPGAIRGTSSEKLYQEFGLESWKLRRWFRKLCHFL